MEFVKVDLSKLPPRKSRAESAVSVLRRMQVGDGIPMQHLGYKLSTMLVAAVKLRKADPAFARASWRVVEVSTNRVFTRVA